MKDYQREFILASYRKMEKEEIIEELLERGDLVDKLNSRVKKAEERAKAFKGLAINAEARKLVVEYKYPEDIKGGGDSGLDVVKHMAEWNEGMFKYQAYLEKAEEEKQMLMRKLDEAQGIIKEMQGRVL